MIAQPNADDPPRIIRMFPADQTSSLDATQRITLRMFYETELLADFEEEHSKATRREYRTALKHWESTTFDPDFREVSNQTIRQFRDGMLAKDLAPATCQKYWAHLAKVFRIAKDEGWISRRPGVSRSRKTQLVKVPPKTQRRVLLPDTVNRLVVACEQATYPLRANRTRLWQVLLYLFWTYGIRTKDLISLARTDVDLETGFISFEAMKTSKLQSLPITDLGIKLLRSIETQTRSTWFPGFVTTGCWISKRKGRELPESERRWKRGYYCTWNSEICPAAKVIPSTGPESVKLAVAAMQDHAPVVWLKHFRECMVTQLNDASGHIGSVRKLGNWVAAHYQPGVSENSYDYPLEEIREAIAHREQNCLPDVFRKI